MTGQGIRIVNKDKSNFYKKLFEELYFRMADMGLNPASINRENFGLTKAEWVSIKRLAKGLNVPELDNHIITNLIDKFTKCQP